MISEQSMGKDKPEVRFLSPNLVMGQEQREVFGCMFPNPIKWDREAR